MAISGLFNVGLSALYSIDQALSTTSNNVANANTPGYKRENPILQSIDSGIIKTSGAAGDGVQVTQIQRMYSSFIDQQVNTESSNLAYWNNLQTGMSQIESVFNEASTTGISPAISDFYNAWQDVSQTPEGDAQRTTLIQKANYLSSRLSGAATALDNERNQLLTDSQSLSNTVNSTAAQIADLNTKIAGNPGALDLMNQRDLLMQNLNSIVKVSTFPDSAGMVTVLLGGEPIVQGPRTFALSANTDTSNVMHFYVAVSPGAAQGTPGNPDVTAYLTGGQLKANKDLRDTNIPNYQNSLNAFAVNLADTTNFYQRQGYGLDSQAGSAFFSSLSQLGKLTSASVPFSVTITGANNTIVFNDGTNNYTATIANGTYSGAGLAAAVQTALNAATRPGPVTTSNTFAVDYGTTVANQLTIKNSTGPAVTINWALSSAKSQQLGYVAKDTNIAAGGTLSSDIFSYAGGTLSIKLGDNDSSPLSVNIAANSTVGDVVNAINNQAGSKVAAIAVNIGTTANPDYRIKILSNPDGRLADVRIGVTTTDTSGSGLNLLATSTAVTSMSVTDPSKLSADAQYNIDYINAATYGSLSAADKAGYQVENADGLSYVINTTDNTIQINGAAVTIPSATYSGPGLASALQTQLDKLNSNLTVTYNTSGANIDKFTISNNPVTITAGVNDTIVYNDGVADRTATIAPGTYSGAGLASAIQTALNTAPGSGNTFAVDYGTTVANQISIKNTAGPAVTIEWNNPPHTLSTATPQEFGLASGTTSAVGAGGTLSSVNATLTFDWANANSTAAGMLGFSKSDAPTAISVNGTSTSDFSTGNYWRVQKSTDGSTWTTISPNLSYDPSTATSLDQTKVNMVPDSSGSLWRTFEFEGVKVRIDGNDISSVKNPNGETFNVQLDQHAAQDIATALTNSSKVAAATDMFSVDSSNNTVVFNVNGGANITAVIPQGAYTNDTGQSDDISAALTSAIQTAYQNSTGGTLPDTMQVAFNQQTKQFKIMMPNGSDTVNLLWTNSASTAKQLFGFSGSNDSTVADGSSAVSDNVVSVLSSASKGVPGDNRNALAVASLATENSFAGATPVDFYNSLVSAVGEQSSSSSTSQKFQSQLVDQLTQKQQAVSGVSMDEEASNLIKYQQSYQAAAKLITVANDLLTTLIGMVK
ncbi:MAG: flagellar hook-associated protein FlgK [Nitrospirae bacterium]|nr:flagellar hook-associated protein FlgK [Nitrospirota bacterium]